MRAKPLLPLQFVWTRYGYEAGEEINRILIRKEHERCAADGIFLWGIGNSIIRGVRALLAREVDSAPVVVFSPMLSTARQVDVAPPIVARWMSAIRTDGSVWQLPKGAIVTSRVASLEKPRRRYALVCYSESPIKVNAAGERFDITDLVNIESRAPVGASQVTAVVERVQRVQGAQAGQYVAAFSAVLMPPYVVELCDPYSPDSICRPAPRPAQLGLL